MKKAIAIALFTFACGSKSTPTTTTTTPPTPDQTAKTEPEPKQEAPAPKAAAMTTKDSTTPGYGTWGFDIAGMNKDAKPGDSFFEYGNGSWAKNTKIPDDKSNYGLFGVLADLSDERTKDIIQNAKGAPGSEAKKIADYYKSFMDEAAIEAKGFDPIKPELEKIAAIKDAKGLATRFAEQTRMGTKSPIPTFVDQDEKDPEHYIAQVAQGGLGLPDRDMYMASTKQFAPVREGYKKYLTTLFTLIGDKEADKKAAGVYALEEKIAAVHWTKIQNRDPQKTYNKMTVAQIAKLAPGVDWKAWFEAAGLSAQTSLVVRQPTAIAGIAKLVKSEPIDVWKDYLTVQLVSSSAPFLPKAFVDARFEMYGKTLAGIPQNKDRWKRGVDQVTDALGEAVGKIYAEKYFTAATKAKADELVKNLLAAMGDRLDHLTWMSPATKAKAKAKLATYNPKIGYPKKWRDYSALDVVAGDPAGNDMRAHQFEYNRNLAKLGTTVDRDEWGMTPMTVNAYYNPAMNEIVFPAAILQPPFFDPNADAAVNYGAIGAVIGHEISHGFDDQGSQYDEKGALKNWWTKQDTKKFKAATAKLVAQYDKYCPIGAKDGKPAQCVKGKLTLGENIADLAGLTIAFEAYKKTLNGQEAPVIDGFTGDQRFYLGFAQIWRRLYREPELANRLVTDPHSPSEQRVSTVRNLDPWYEAFKPSDKDALFLPANKRIRIW